MLCTWAWEVGYSELGYPGALGDSLAMTQGWVGRSSGGPSHTVCDCRSTMAAALIQKLWLLLGKIRSWPLVILIVTLTLLTWSVLRDSRLVVLKHECAADHWRSFVKLLYIQSESLDKHPRCCCWRWSTFWETVMQKEPSPGFTTSDPLYGNLKAKPNT